MYVTGLVAPHTVNTMPLETVDGYQDHGLPLPQPFGPSEITGAHRVLDELEEVGIDMEDVTRLLEEQGVEKFSKSWEDLQADVEAKRAAVA
jgi:transaldolase